MEIQETLDMDDTDRLDVIEALETAGWIGDNENPLSLLRKNGASFAVTGGLSLSGPTGWTAEFPLETPAAVVVAACLAAAEIECTCIHEPEEDAGVLLHASYCPAV